MTRLLQSAPNATTRAQRASPYQAASPAMPPNPEYSTIHPHSAYAVVVYTMISCRNSARIVCMRAPHAMMVYHA